MRDALLVPRRPSPLRISKISCSVALHNSEATRLLERQALAALPAHTLMRRAGAEVARWVLALSPHAKRVWIAGGPGNNGGDGLNAAIALQAAGKLVSVSHLISSGGLPADAQDALERAHAAGVVFTDEPPELLASDVALDALLGVGATRGPEGAIAHRVRQLGALACPVLAVDIPTGLCANTGRLLGQVAVSAQHTLSLLTLKPGLFTAEGRDHAGCVWWSSLAVACNEPPSAWLIGLDHQVAASAEHSMHKGRRGDTLVLGGAAGMAGAAWLAARAAHAAGSGRVFVSLLDADAATPDFTRPELMVRPAGWPNTQAALADCTVVAGCGGGVAIASLLPRLLSVAHRLVLDADGLNAVASDSNLTQLLRARALRGLNTVLTPHPLEAARLLGCTVADIQADRLGSAKRLAQQTSAVVVLKGSGTVVAPPQGTPWINPTGNAALSTAGTGDVLAGWLGGRWASTHQTSTNISESTDDGALAAALQTVYLHGLAAEQANVNPVRAADLVDYMLRTRSQAA